VLKQLSYNLLYAYIVLVKSFLVKMLLSGQMAVVCKALLAVCVHCGAVHYLWEKDQDYDFAVLCNIDL